MLFLGIFTMLFLWGLIYLVTKDLLSPASISGIVWFLVYIILFITSGDRIFKDENYCIFALAYALFAIGFLISYPKKSINNHISYRMEWNTDFRRGLCIINYVAAFSWLLASYQYIITGSGGIWASVREAVGELDSLQSGIAGIMQNVVIMYFIVSYAFFLTNKTVNNKKNLIISIPPLLMVMLLSSRGIWYFLIISVVMIGMLIHNTSNMKVIKIGVLGIIGFLIIFIVSSFQKYEEAFSSYSMTDKLLTVFKSYFSTPPVAFVQWMETNTQYYHGAYIFRFIFAILSKLGMNVEVVDTVQPFVYVDGVATNVYTALHWYASDYGIISIVFVELILGFLFGKLYKKARCTRTPSIFVIVLYSMLIFTIVIQFFYEQFFSIMSIWIQRFILLFLFTKTKLSKSGDKGNEYQENI